MKSVLGCLSDPIVHVFVVGLVLFRLALAAGGSETVEAGEPFKRCETCARLHPNHVACHPVVSGVVETPGR
jgi:hypothetical protein